MPALIIWLGSLIGVEITGWLATTIAAGVTWLGTYLAIKWGVATWVVNRIATIGGMPQMPNLGADVLHPTGVAAAYQLGNTFFPLNELFTDVVGLFAFWIAAIVWKRAWSGINKVSNLSK